MRPRGFFSDTEINPYNQKPYSNQYYKILESRKKLPVFEKRNQIVTIVKENRVVIIEGSTGSGKTTQIPQFLLEAAIVEPNLLIACTQPRRVAATSVSSRVAQEMDLSIPGIVGYSVRYDYNYNDETRLLYMTDGVLLREFMSDTLISRYGLVIIDEAHERTINSDIILGLLKMALAKRNNLKVVVMSATIEAKKFVKFFSDANMIPPHLSVPGKTFPVEFIYSKNQIKNYKNEAIDIAVSIHSNEKEGDILIFLTGEDDIENVRSSIREQCLSVIPKCQSIKSVMCLPMYSSLPFADQARVFDPAPKPEIRKIIISTNIAETSVTIDGIVYVIDSGLVKQTQYNPIKRMTSLLPVAISKASATQRAGRAGRTKPGKCYRLYSLETFQTVLPEQTTPEINRSDLVSVVLLMFASNIKDIINFPYIDAPHQQLLITAVEELYHLGAIDISGKMTEIGWLMSSLPVEPTYSRAIVAAKDFGCVEEIVTLVALLSQQGKIFIKPREEKARAEHAHSQFYSETGDHLALLNVFNSFYANQTFDWCKRHYLDYRTLSGALSTKNQLISLLHRLGVDITSISLANPNVNDIILQAFLQGSFIKIACYNQSINGYRFLINEEKALIHPSSCLKSTTNEWVMYNESVFTGIDYIRVVSVINPKWIVPASPTYFVPHRFIKGIARTKISHLKEEYDLRNKVVVIK